METVRFDELDLYPQVLRAIKEMGFEEATPIQSQAIPVVMSGVDVIGQAQTGTGKTASFGIPVLHKVDPNNKKTQVIILSPTRELAIQVSEEIRKLSKYMHGVKILPVYGGQDINRQIKAEKVMQGIGEIIENEDLKEMIEIIEKQVNDSDYTAMDIAAAFLKQALGQVNLENDRENGEIDWDNTGAEEGMVRLFINIGKKDRVKPGDILGAIAGESGMPGKLVGAIDMYDKYTFVEVPREYGKEVLEAMKNVKIKGRSVNMEPANQK